MGETESSLSQGFSAPALRHFYFSPPQQPPRKATALRLVIPTGAEWTYGSVHPNSQSKGGNPPLDFSSRGADLLVASCEKNDSAPATKALGGPFKPFFGLSGLWRLPTHFVIPSVAEGSAVPRPRQQPPRKAPLYDLSSRPKRSRISCHAALTNVHVCAFR
jgi:hypothetical protein